VTELINSNGTKFSLEMTYSSKSVTETVDQSPNVESIPTDWTEEIGQHGSMEALCLEGPEKPW